MTSCDIIWHHMTSCDRHVTSCDMHVTLNWLNWLTWQSMCRWQCLQAGGWSDCRACSSWTGPRPSHPNETWSGSKGWTTDHGIALRGRMGEGEEGKERAREKKKVGGRKVRRWMGKKTMNWRGSINILRQNSCKFHYRIVSCDLFLKSKQSLPQKSCGIIQPLPSTTDNKQFQSPVATKPMHVIPVTWCRHCLINTPLFGCRRSRISLEEWRCLLDTLVIPTHIVEPTQLQSFD